MRTMRPAALGLLVLLGQFAAPARADTLTAAATVEGRIGYGTNPFLQSGVTAGSGLVGVTIAPVITLTNEKAVTTLSGSYNRDEYFSRYNHTDDFDVELRRRQQLSARLAATAHVGYFSSISGLLSPLYNSIVIDPGAVDQLAIGLRQRRTFGDLGLEWQPTARDSFYLRGNAEHDSYSRGGNTFNYYGVTGGYSRQVSARTSVGVSVTAAEYQSRQSPDSKSLSPNVTLQRVLSAHWTFNGSVGAIVERERLAGRSRTSVSPGFSVSLCDRQTRLSACFTGSRETASSGLGGLRRQTQFGADVTYSLTEHSRILVTGSYGFSRTDDQLLINPVFSGTLRYALARIAYQRDLGRRLTAGVSGTYESRTGARFPEAHEFAVTLNVSVKLGHM